MKRSKISLSHYHLTTLEMGKLVPVGCYEVLPGDTIRQSTSTLIRVTPMMAPLMHTVQVRIHHFFTPYRILWDHWEDFITGGRDGKQVPALPWCDHTEAFPATQELLSYMGARAETSTMMRLSALPCRAYWRIWDDHYRDQDLQEPLVHSVESGQDYTRYKLQHVSWPKDYFTTARPFQKKGPDITLPIGHLAPVRGIGNLRKSYDSNKEVYETDRGKIRYEKCDSIGSDVYLERSKEHPDLPGIYADLSDASGVSIEDLRLAFGLQRYQEARARYGSRYVEYLRSLGVRSQDGRLQDPEYLGGGRAPLQVSEVLASTGTDTQALGKMGGHGIAAMRSNRFIRYMPEHGVVLSLMSVVPKSIYMTATHRSWMRQCKEDFYTPELAALSEQAVYRGEVFPDMNSQFETFGYVPRYDEYRWQPSYVSGLFRTTEKHWHMARDLATKPELNSSFISCVPTKRVFADTSADSHPVYAYVAHSIQARRPMPYMARPK